MDRETLKTIVIEQHEQYLKKPTGIARDQLSEVEKHLELPHAIVISGIRRCGKSTLLRQIQRKHYPDANYYLNFDDERLLTFTVDDFNVLYEIFLELYDEQQTFFFDEIQNIEKWESFVRRMCEDGFKFFITGSNAALLSKELGTRLTGRHVPIELYPFSFSEFLTFNEIKPNTSALTTKSRALLNRLLKNYLQHGGMPEYLLFKNEETLKNLYENVLYRDIIVRFKIKEDKILRELSNILLSNIANLISYNKLKNILSLGSANTIKNYISHMENAYLLFEIAQFNFSIQQQTLSNKKIYGIDPGIINFNSFKFSKNTGNLLENIVFLELKRKKQDLFYYKTNNGLEIDFVIRQGVNIIELIQVCKTLSEEKTKQRELNALFTAMNECQLNTATIITMSHKETITQEKKTIHIVPFYEWVTLYGNNNAALAHRPET